MWLSGPSQPPPDAVNSSLRRWGAGSSRVNEALKVPHAMSACVSTLGKLRGGLRCGIVLAAAVLRGRYSSSMSLLRPRSAPSSSPTMPTAMASTAAWRPARAAACRRHRLLPVARLPAGGVVPQGRSRRDHRRGPVEQRHLSRATNSSPSSACAKRSRTCCSEKTSPGPAPGLCLCATVRRADRGRRRCTPVVFGHVSARA